MQQQVGEQDLRLDHADVGGALDPGAPFLGVRIHPAAFHQHAPIPVLGVDDPVGGATQPNVAIVLTNYLNGSPADQDALAGLIAKGALNGVTFHADDLDAVFGRLQEAGAEIVQEPTDQPWGARDCAVRDPSGNLIRIDQLR